MPRKPVCRIASVLPEALDHKLIDQLFTIWCERFTGIDRDAFVRLALTQSMEVALLYDKDERLVGFTNISIYPDITPWSRRSWAPHTVFGAGMYILATHQGQRLGSRWLLIRALRYMLRHPLTVMGYTAIAGTPLSYQIMARALRCYPHPEREPSAAMTQLMGELHRRRGFEHVPGDPWLLQSTIRPREPQRVLRAQTLRDDPLIAFYLRRAPRWAEGSPPVLWVPLDLSNILTALTRITVAKLRVAPSHRGA